MRSALTSLSRHCTAWKRVSRPARPPAVSERLLMMLLLLVPMLCIGTQDVASLRRVLQGSATGTRDLEKQAENARTVLAAIVKAAGENHRLPPREAAGARAPFQRNGDELTVHYIRTAA